MNPKIIPLAFLNPHICSSHSAKPYLIKAYTFLRCTDMATNAARMTDPTISGTYTTGSVKRICHILSVQ